MFWHATLFPERTQPWLQPELPAPRFPRIWARVAPRAAIQEPGLDLLPVLYEHLSRASHFDPLVLVYSFRWRGVDPDFFPVEPPLDAIGLQRGAEMLLPLTSLVLGALVRWIASDDAVWWHQEVVACRADIEGWEAKAEVNLS